ncbi:MAG: hypothetical protein QW625_03800 [Candidatus Nanoarchaeia archaeon]
MTKINMADPRLIDYLIKYIKLNLSRGASLEQIKQSLLAQGWSNYDINTALNLAVQQTFPKPIEYNALAKKSSKPWIILVLVVAFVIIGSIGGVALFMLTEKEIPKVTPTPPAQELKKPSGPIDCGTDIDCFIAAVSQNCTPAKVTNNVTLDIFGVTQTQTSYYETKGLEAGKCIFYSRIEKIDLTFPPGTPQDIIDQQKEIYKKFEGRDGNCKFSSSDLVAVLSRWKEGHFNGSASCTLIDERWNCTYTGDWEVAEDCQGMLFSQEL